MEIRRAQLFQTDIRDVRRAYVAVRKGDAYITAVNLPDWICLQEMPDQTGDFEGDFGTPHVGEKLENSVARFGPAFSHLCVILLFDRSGDRLPIRIQRFLPVVGCRHPDVESDVGDQEHSGDREEPAL